MRGEPLDRAWQVGGYDPRRQRLIVPEEDQVGTDGADGSEEVIGISYDDRDVRECTFDSCGALPFGLIWNTPLDAQNVAISRHDDAYISPLQRRADHELVAGMQTIECAEEEDFHRNIVCGISNVEYHIPYSIHFVAKSTTYTLFSSKIYAWACSVSTTRS